MGDYKLKTAEDYVVPEQLRMNTNKALRRILGQEEFVSPVVVLVVVIVVIGIVVVVFVVVFFVVVVVCIACVCIA